MKADPINSMFRSPHALLEKKMLCWQTTILALGSTTRYIKELVKTGEFQLSNFTPGECNQGPTFHAPEFVACVAEVFRTQVL